MSKQVAIITVGISGSGKTYWAEQFCESNTHFRNINRDDIRSYLYPFQHSEEDTTPYYKDRGLKEREFQVTRHASTLIDRYLDEGMNIVISDTNLNQHFRYELVKYLIGRGVRVEYKIFTTDLTICLKRDEERSRKVGRDIILSQYNKLIHFLSNYESEIKYVRNMMNIKDFRDKVEESENGSE